MGLHGISLEEVFKQTEEYLKEASDKDEVTLENSTVRKLFDLAAYASEASQLPESEQNTFLEYANGLTKICVDLGHPAMDKERGSYEQIQDHFPTFINPLAKR